MTDPAPCPTCAARIRVLTHTDTLTGMSCNPEERLIQGALNNAREDVTALATNAVTVTHHVTDDGKWRTVHTTASLTIVLPPEHP
ncbi:hypothetical protein [Deinococcus kurensis]|uniref:hypothetical protein n=1 Tax=Deinococcus kurensis TaxID=2662757 RepID=UPI0012D33A85|nr:hypothetical protein [Deinococcus kurensis]